MCLRLEVNLTLPFGRDCRAGPGQRSDACAVCSSGRPAGQLCCLLLGNPGFEGGTAAGTGRFTRTEQSRANTAADGRFPMDTVSCPVRNLNFSPGCAFKE